jgi:hypothetical protein
VPEGDIRARLSGGKPRDRGRPFRPQLQNEDASECGYVQGALPEPRRRFIVATERLYDNCATGQEKERAQPKS